MAQPQPQGPDYKHIVRIANVDLPGNQLIAFSLTNIKGIGVNIAHVFCTIAKIDHAKKTGNLTQEEIERINAIINEPLKHGVPQWMSNRRKDYETGEDKHLLTGALNFVVENDLKRHKKIKSYRGVRHLKGLPVRGQRTKSNFRRNKGKVVGVAKKKEAPAKSDSGKSKSGGKPDKAGGKGKK